MAGCFACCEVLSYTFKLYFSSLKVLFYGNPTIVSGIPVLNNDSPRGSPRHSTNISGDNNTAPTNIFYYVSEFPVFPNPVFQQVV